jgi:hypothetical protein
MAAMNDTGYTRNYLRAAGERPDLYERHIRSTYGFSAAGTEALLRMAAKLQQRDHPKLNAEDVRVLKQLHPQTNPREIDNLVAALNDTSKVAPHQRSDIFVSVLASDLNGAAGRVDLHSADTRHVKSLRDTMQQIEISDAILAKQARNGKPQREPAPYVESETRQIIRSQLEPRGLRPLRAEMEREGLDGGPVTDLVRHGAADKLEAAFEKLAPDADVSLRESLSAAADAVEIEGLGRDQGWIGDEE